MTERSRFSILNTSVFYVILIMQSSTIRACIPNISTRETRKRLLSGMIMLVFGLSVLVALLAIGINPLWRLALFPVFFGAAVGVFQWRGKT